MADRNGYIGRKYRLIRGHYASDAYQDQFGKKHPGIVVQQSAEVTVIAVGHWNNGYQDDTPLLIAEAVGDDKLVFNGYVNTIDYWGGVRWSERVARDTGWQTFKEREVYVNEDGTPFVWPEKTTLRDDIRKAIDAAYEAGDLSEDWAASLYANLDEPPSDDERGWEILNNKENT